MGKTISGHEQLTRVVSNKDPVLHKNPYAFIKSLNHCLMCTVIKGK